MSEFYTCADHLEKSLNPVRLRDTVGKVLCALKGYEFDAIAFRGMSGALVAPIVAMEMGKELILVRKESDSTHSPFNVEGYYSAKTYVILDDYMSSGNTVEAILSRVKEDMPFARCLGVLEYYNLPDCGYGQVNLKSHRVDVFNYKNFGERHEIADTRRKDQASALGMDESKRRVGVGSSGD